MSARTKKVSGFYRGLDRVLVFLGTNNFGWAFGAGALITTILTSSITSHLQSLGNYFTNWSLLVQLAAYTSFLNNPKSHLWLHDLSTVLVWTVALSFAIVTIASEKLRDDMYELYGVFGFWVGNTIIHYLPLIFNYATFYHAFLADKDMSPVTRPPQRIWHVLLVAGLSVALLVVYSATHDTKKVYHNDIDEFNGSFWMGLVLLVPILFIVFNRNAVEFLNVLSHGKKESQASTGPKVSNLVY